MLTRLLGTAAAVAAVLPAQTPILQTIPAAFATAEANSLEWVAGTGSPVRQQTIVGSSHLTSLQGRALTALELRRAAFAAAFQPAQMHWVVTLSHAPHGPLQCRDAFAANVGANPVTVYSGTVQAPASPANTTTPPAWTTDNTIRVVFQTPFVYTGGPLCLDITGTPVAGQTSDWWVSDAVWEDVHGTVVEVGAGCGLYGGPQRRWAGAAPYTLLPGARAQFWAYGTPGGFGIAAFGVANAGPIPLAALGVPAPGCDVHLNPALVLATTIHLFELVQAPLYVEGKARSTVPLPADPSVFGLSLTTQWFDLAQPATSNALTWTVASQIPTLDLAHVDGDPTEATGNVTLHLAPVYRFEAQ